MTQFPSRKKNHCYSLKLAMLRRPDDHKLHDYILDNMDLDKFTEPKLKYEILCLLGHFKGCTDATFLKLFKEHVWLMG